MNSIINVWAEIVNFIPFWLDASDVSAAGVFSIRQVKATSTEMRCRSGGPLVIYQGHQLARSLQARELQAPD